jgi:hypothetical protein
MNDQRKACYAAALIVWRTRWDSLPGRKPLPSAFGLSMEEALEIEDHGHSLDGLPEHLRPAVEP